MLLFVLLVGVVLCAPEEYRIKNLPGAPDIDFKMYSGLVTVNMSLGRQVFFWFVESQRKPESDPVVLWLNGGPLCSSLAGFLQEHGPFRAKPDGKSLSLFPYAWNRVANVIYLESPGGVGFGECDKERGGCAYDDQSTADGNLAFLIWFRENFPEFSGNEFVLSAESYGGHYGSNLMNHIYEYNQRVSEHLRINLTKSLLGNPGLKHSWYFIIDYGNAYPTLNYLYTHAIISQDTFLEASAACGWDKYLTTCDNFTSPSPACEAAVTKAYSHVPTSEFDFYAVTFPTCNPSGPKQPLLVIDGVEFLACAGNYLTSYLNHPEVKAAIHAPNKTWVECGGSGLSYGSERADMMPIIEKLLKVTDTDMLIYSGDDDSAVPFIGTQRLLTCLAKKMGMPVRQPWTQWKRSDGQRGGAVIGWSGPGKGGLTFATIKHAGHLVPYFSPMSAFDVFAQWLKGGLVT